MQSPSHPESTNSTPRSRTESWAEEASNTTQTTTAKIRLMCSYGGQIVPRSHDRMLCYLNGDTRMVAIDKNNVSLADLIAKIARSIPSTHPRPFLLKYQLPSEDLDSLISLTTDEDLENMIDEHDRIAEVSGNGLKPRRIRVFIFPERKKTGEEGEDWFLEALNSGGITHNSADSLGSSVNYLLGLEEDDRNLNNNNNNNNHSSCSSVVTESAAIATTTVPPPPRQMETFSSFGSSASSPSSNLAPIRVRVDEDRATENQNRAMENQRFGLEEGFAQMGISCSEQKPDDGFGGNLFNQRNHPQLQPNPISTAVSLPAKLTDNITVSDSFPKSFSSADQKSPPPPTHLPQPPRHQERVSPSNTANIADPPKQDDDDHPHSVSDSSYRHQLPPDQTYAPPPHHNYQQQYIHVPQMIPMPPQSSYFQVPQPHLYSQNGPGPIYYVPIQRPPNLPDPPQPHFAVQPRMRGHLMQSKSQFGTTTPLPPQLMHIGGGGGGDRPQQYVGYGYESVHYQPPATEAAMFYSQAAASSVAPPQYQTMKSEQS